MKNITKLTVALIATVTLALVGCGSTDFSIAPVSGKVTCDGKPVSGIRVVFTPKPNVDNTDPGPWSTAVTNDQGEFTLATRYDKPGAAIGKHTVDFEIESSGNSSNNLEELEEDLESAIDEGEKAEAAALKKKIADLKVKSKGKPNIPESFSLEFEVPEGGSSEANFDLPVHK